MKARLIAIAAAIFLLEMTTSYASQLLGLASYYPGPSPFISFVQLRVTDTSTLKNIQFTIAPKTGSATRPINVTYSRANLLRRGYLVRGKVTVPVFGLYSGRSNSVTITLGFRDGTSQQTVVNIVTDSYDAGTYSAPNIVQARLPGTTLSYDYIMLKSYAQPTTPIIIDSDAEIRWVGTANVGSQPSAMFDNAFYLTSGTSLLRTDFDGATTTIADYSNIGVTGFHHNIDIGKTGMVLDVDTTTFTECTNLEVDAAGVVLKTWNFADIISAAMTAGGDDPSQFVQPTPIDWFHNNCTAYRASDNSFVVSSRENFVIAVDYDTSAIKWILGDQTKKWYEFQSLRNFALALDVNSLPPAGQHGISFVADKLLLFDDGTGSSYQMPPGVTRTYSATRKYSLNLQSDIATEIYTYLADPSIYSPYCSSVYEDKANNYLIDYTLGGPYVFTGIVGLDGQGNKAFDYRYDELDFCGTAWNATILHWENLVVK